MSKALSCPKCGLASWGDLDYCPECGQPWTIVCEDCGGFWRYYLEYAFCPACGSSKFSDRTKVKSKKDK